MAIYSLISSSFNFDGVIHFYRGNRKISQSLAWLSKLLAIYTFLSASHLFFFLLCEFPRFLKLENLKDFFQIWAVRFGRIVHRFAFGFIHFYSCFLNLQPNISKAGCCGIIVVSHLTFVLIVPSWRCRVGQHGEGQTFPGLLPEPRSWTTSEVTTSHAALSHVHRSHPGMKCSLARPQNAQGHSTASDKRKESNRGKAGLERDRGLSWFKIFSFFKLYRILGLCQHITMPVRGPNLMLY